MNVPKIASCGSATVVYLWTQVVIRIGLLQSVFMYFPVLDYETLFLHQVFKWGVPLIWSYTSGNMIPSLPLPSSWLPVIRDARHLSSLADSKHWRTLRYCSYFKLEERITFKNVLYSLIVSLLLNWTFNHSLFYFIGQTSSFQSCAFCPSQWNETSWNNTCM